MTTTFDLRTAFARSIRSSMPKRPQRAFENDVDDLDTTAGKEGAGRSGGSTRESGSTDAGDTDEDAFSSLPADNAEDAEQDDNEDKPKKSRNKSRIKELSDEAGRRRREAKELRTQVDELKRKLEGKQSTDDLESTIRTLRLELAFERMATTSRINDVEAAWRLAADDLKAVEIKDGQVDPKRLEEIVDHVAKRYPYLTDDYAPQETVVSGEGASGRPVNGKRRSDVGLDRQALEKRFPALRRMR